jgi:UDP-N-acetylmuramate dehydrogenase
MAVPAELIATLTARLGTDRVREDAALAPLTTFRVGGTADVLVDTRSSDEMVAVLQLAGAHGVPVTLLGGGSNVLIHDAGVRGVVMHPRGGEIHRLGPSAVRADAAVTINGLVRWTINRGLAGLEAWAGTPGTVGGAIYGNAHWQRTNIGDLVETVRLARRDGTLLQAPADRMAFDYDDSRLKRTGEVVLWAAFRVTPGADPEALRATARASLAFRKRTQPLHLPSAGCIFMNPDPSRDRLPEGMPPSAGALIDRAGLKGASEGGAQVSEAHANFIVNRGGATAADIARLIARCRAAVRDHFGVSLREEIVRLGFDEAG